MQKNHKIILSASLVMVGTFQTHISQAASLYSVGKEQVQYPKAETKKEFMQRLNNAYERSKILKDAGDNLPYQDVEKTLKANWKSGFIEKNPGKFALIVVASVAAVVALVAYSASH